MTRQPAPEGWVGLIAAIIADTPSLPGAACAGRSELFDPRRDNEPYEAMQRRQEAARRIREWTCPVQPERRSWVESLKPTERPRGVIAGVIPGDAPPGRPRRAIPACMTNRIHHTTERHHQ